MINWIKINNKRYEFDDFFQSINGKKYKFVNFIASGGNSLVYEVCDEREESFYAIKVLKFLNKKDEFDQEISFMENFSKPGYIDNFITLHDKGEILIHQTKKARKGATRTGDTIQVPFFIMDRADDKTIKEFLCDTNLPSKSEQDIFPYVQKLAESLKMIHSEGYVHRDIKPKNILMQGTVPKLADFGLMVKENECQEKRAPKFWPTPEYISLCDPGEHCAHKETDIFQLGCIFFYLYTGKYPIGILETDALDTYKLKPVIEKMISYDRTSRYGSGEELYLDIMEKITS